MKGIDTPSLAPARQGVSIPFTQLRGGYFPFSRVTEGEIVGTALREMPAAWSVTPRDSRWLAGGSRGLGDSDLEDLG